MNQIEFVQVDNDTYELEMVSFKRVLDQIHLLKPKGCYYNRLTNRWACPSHLFSELKQNIFSLAHIIEPVSEPPIKKIKLDMESDDYKQIYISHLNPYKISVKLSNYDAQIVASIKEIKGAYFSKPFWIVKVEDLDILKTKLEQFKEWNLVETLDTVR